MNTKNCAIALVVASAAIASEWLWQSGSVPLERAASSHLSESEVRGNMMPASSTGQRDVAASPPDVAVPRSPLDSVALPLFRSSQGHVVINAQARIDMERVALLYGRDEALSRLDAATQDMGPQAQREVRELYQQFMQYNEALATALPQSTADQVTLDEARRELQDVKELRVQYFGAAKAEQMFAQEEAMQQQLLEDASDAMRTQNLSQSQAIELAQAKLGRQLGN
jgi:hypothetical protein